MKNNTMELLNKEKINSLIEPKNQPYLSKLEIFNEIDSTNTYLLNQARSKPLSGWVCLAEQQMEGRGRLGREWFSPYGYNIYCSLLWRFKDPHPDLSGLSIAVGVMVVNSLKKGGIHQGIQLKWPNDVLFDGRKLAGILIERSGDYIVVGVGLNVYLPEMAQHDWAAVAEICKGPVSRNFFAGLLINELLSHLPVYQEQGLKAFLSDWHQCDFLFHKNIVVLLPSEKEVFGVMQGVTNTGEMILKNEKGELQYFHCGEVSVRCVM